ncbi:MAG: glutamate--tRNA ligase, partial [Carnobacterium sp.]|nr:glutamate--tRNA ligase [Carnobacterium sp.]
PDRLSKSPAAFDPKKLDWINNQYMKQTDLETVTKLAMPHLVKAGYVEENLSDDKKEWVQKVIGLYHDQMSYGAEITTLASLFFTETPELDEAAKEILAGETVLEVLNAFDKVISELENFDAVSIKAGIKSIQKETGIKGKNLFMPIRVGVTGQVHGPELPETIELLGRKKTKAHLQTAISHL